MKKSLNILTVTAVLIIGLCIPALAGSVWNAADSAAPIAVRYNDAANVGTIQVTSSAVIVTDDGEANTYSYQPAYDTLGEVLAAINSATNGTGDKNFEAVYWAGISADALTNSYLTVLAATTLTKQWNYDVKWDTSTCKHYDSAVGVMVGTTPVSEGKIDRIFGDPTGTGNVTLSVYVDGSVKWSRVITSPVYVKAVDNATNVADASSAFDYEVNIAVGSQPAFVRAARATTATTGGIGISDKRR